MAQALSVKCLAQLKDTIQQQWWILKQHLLGHDSGTQQMGCIAGNPVDKVKPKSACSATETSLK